LYEPELHVGGDVLVPDWAGWRRSRMPRLPETAHIPLAPDWVCEIVSPSTSSLDRVQKLAIYAREKVAHAWLIDPAGRSLEVLGLHEGRWTILGAYMSLDVVRAEPFSEIALELSALWVD
jgi:Uma2 family endonuclease